MSEFLLVVPEGFTELPHAAQLIGQGGGLSAWNDAISTKNFDEMNNLENLRDSQYLPTGYVITDARVFDTGDVQRLWITIAPE